MSAKQLDHHLEISIASEKPISNSCLASILGLLREDLAETERVRLIIEQELPKP